MHLCKSQVIWKRLYSTASADQHGTLYQIRNLLHRTNVPKDPKSNVDACEEFFSFTVVCHVLASAMTVLGLETLDDLPSKQDIPEWTASEEERKSALKKISSSVVDTFVSFSFSEHEVGGKADDSF